ncbi:TPA: hypothetical protein N0F65_005683 [Lagenidium giganteum]
MTSTW